MYHIEKNLFQKFAQRYKKVFNYTSKIVKSSDLFAYFLGDFFLGGFKTAVRSTPHKKKSTSIGALSED